MKNPSSGMAAPVDAMQIFSARPNPSAFAERLSAETRCFRKPKLSNADRDRLGNHVAHFNARDFDAIRAMTADDVRLDHAPYVIDGAEYPI
jgi:hypothetical protein